MKNKIICIDLDNTLISWKSNFWDIVSDVMGLSLEPPKDYEFLEYPKEVRDAIYRIFNKEWYMCDLPRPSYFAIDFLKRCKKENCRVYIVTSRSKIIKMPTYFMIYGMFGDLTYYTEITNGKDKLDFLKKVEADVWIDDDPNQCVTTVNAGIETYMIRKSYNREARKNIKIKNVLDLEDVHNNMWGKSAS